MSNDEAPNPGKQPRNWNPERDARASGSWPDGDPALLDDLAAFVRRFVVLSPDQALAVALFVLHTWALDAADYTPYLHVSSPEKRSGKTRLLQVLGLLCRRPESVANASVAALCQLAAEEPTLLWDEVDTLFGRRPDEKTEEMRGILNAGFERGACVVRGNRNVQQGVIRIPVFCPKVLCGLAPRPLPDTLADRTIPVTLKRKTQEDMCERLRMGRNAPPAAATLRERAERWASPDRIEALTEAQPEMPDALDDRAQDVCAPLVAIADTFGPQAGQAARTALVALRAGLADEDDSLGAALLAACRAAFHQGDTTTTSLSSSDLVARLNEDHEAPWAEWPLTQKKLSDRLRPFKVKSAKLRYGTDTFRGYTRSAFTDAWARYLPNEVEQGAMSHLETGRKPHEYADVPLVPLQPPIPGVEAPPAPPDLRRCRYEGHLRYWRAVASEKLICNTCHPAPPETAVTEWYTIPTDAPLAA